jgi:hypothetical protein
MAFPDQGVWAAWDGAQDGDHVLGQLRLST